MNDAYEFYDYGDFFPIVSSSSIRMKDESKNNTNAKYLKELKRKANEATRKAFTDKLSDRIKELNEVLNTKALEEMILYYEDKPIKLKKLMFDNMKKTAKIMSDNNLLRTTVSDSKDIDVKNVNSGELNSSISTAFNSSNLNSGFEVPAAFQVNEVGSDTVENNSLPPVVGDAALNNIDDGKDFFSPAGNMQVNEVGSDTVENNSLPSFVGDATPNNINDGKDFFSPAGDMLVNEVGSGTVENNSLPPVVGDAAPNNINDGNNFFSPAGNMQVNEVGSGTVENNSLPPVVGDAALNNIDDGKDFFSPAGNMQVNEVGSDTVENNSLPSFVGDATPNNINDGKDFFSPAGDMLVNEVGSGTVENNSLPPVVGDAAPNNINDGNNFFSPAGNMQVNEVGSGTVENNSLPPVVGDADLNNIDDGKDFFSPAGNMQVNEVSSGITGNSLPSFGDEEDKINIDKFIRSNLGLSKEDTNVSGDDRSQIETGEFDPSLKKNTSGDSYVSDDQLQEKIADFIGARPTKDGYTFPVAVSDHNVDSPVEDSKDNIRGENVQIVPDREDSSMSAEINYEDTNASESDKTTGEVSDAISSVDIEDANEGENLDSSPAIDPDLGELIGYSKPEGGIDYFSLVPDVMRQFEEAKQNVARLNAEKVEKARKEAESAKNVHTLESEVGNKVRRLFQNTADFERQGSELAGQIDSITQNIANNEQVASMLLGVSSQLDAMLEEATDVDEDVGVKQKK